MEKLKNLIHQDKSLLDVKGDEWFYGKMQVTLGANNTKDNSILLSTTDNDLANNIIVEELNFVFRPLAVKNMNLDVIMESQK